MMPANVTWASEITVHDVNGPKADARLKKAIQHEDQPHSPHQPQVAFGEHIAVRDVAAQAQQGAKAKPSEENENERRLSQDKAPSGAISYAVRCPC